MYSGISDITVDKVELIDILLANREKHASVFEAARRTFRVMALERLEGLLQQIDTGWVGHLSLSQPVPEDHSSDYDRAIAMLRMHQGTSVTLSEEAYRQLVDDEWEWSARWGSNTRAYTDGTMRA